MTLSCIIVDDEPLAVRLLESFVSKTPDLTLLASFTDSVEAINAVKRCLYREKWSLCATISN